MMLLCCVIIILHPAKIHYFTKTGNIVSTYADQICLFNNKSPAGFCSSLQVAIMTWCPSCLAIHAVRHITCLAPQVLQEHSTTPHRDLKHTSSEDEKQINSNSITSRTTGMSIIILSSSFLFDQLVQSALFSYGIKSHPLRTSRTPMMSNNNSTSHQSNKSDLSNHLPCKGHSWNNYELPLTVHYTAINGAPYTPIVVLMVL